MATICAIIIIITIIIFRVLHSSRSFRSLRLPRQTPHFTFDVELQRCEFIMRHGMSRLWCDSINVSGVFGFHTWKQWRKHGNYKHFYSNADDEWGAFSLNHLGLMSCFQFAWTQKQSKKKYKFISTVNHSAVIVHDLTDFQFFFLVFFSSHFVRHEKMRNALDACSKIHFPTRASRRRMQKSNGRYC